MKERMPSFSAKFTSLDAQNETLQAELESKRTKLLSLDEKASLLKRLQDQANPQPSSRDPPSNLQSRLYRLQSLQISVLQNRIIQLQDKTKSVDGSQIYQTLLEQYVKAFQCVVHEKNDAKAIRALLAGFKSSLISISHYSCDQALQDLKAQIQVRKAREAQLHVANQVLTKKLNDFQQGKAQIRIKPLRESPKETSQIIKFQTWQRDRDKYQSSSPRDRERERDQRDSPLLLRDSQFDMQRDNAIQSRQRDNVMAPKDQHRDKAVSMINRQRQLSLRDRQRQRQITQKSRQQAQKLTLSQISQRQSRISIKKDYADYAQKPDFKIDSPQKKGKQQDYLDFRERQKFLAKANSALNSQLSQPNSKSSIGNTYEQRRHSHSPMSKHFQLNSHQIRQPMPAPIPTPILAPSAPAPVPAQHQSPPHNYHQLYSRHY